MGHYAFIVTPPHMGLWEEKKQQSDLLRNYRSFVGLYHKYLLFQIGPQGVSHRGQWKCILPISNLNNDSSQTLFTFSILYIMWNGMQLIRYRILLLNTKKIIQITINLVIPSILIFVCPRPDVLLGVYFSFLKIRGDNVLKLH